MPASRGVFLWRAAKAVYSLRTENVKLVGFCLTFTALLSLAYQGVCAEETILLAYMIVHVFVTIAMYTSSVIEVVENRPGVAKLL